MKYPHPPHDAKGRRIRLGSRVRIIGVPALTRMREPERSQTAAVFRHLVGLCKRAQGFDKLGCVELDFRIRRGRHAGMHWVAIEPNLLLVQKRQ
jgi:hypothetical protein